jgi:hypothetical protein
MHATSLNNSHNIDEENVPSKELTMFINIWAVNCHNSKFINK